MDPAKVEAEKEEKRQIQRRLVLHEILNTERRYVEDLQHIKKVFMDPLIETGLLPMETINKIFLNVDALHQLHSRILTTLDEGQPPATVLGREASHFKIYAIYCDSHDAAMELWKTSLEKNSKLKAWEKAITEADGFKMQDFMIKPVQRLCKYPLLLKNLVECIAPGTPEHQGVSEGLNQINAVLAGINSVKEAQENFQALRSYSERIQDFPGLLIKGKRKFLKEGKFHSIKGKPSASLTWTEKEGKSYLFVVFSDILVICVPGKKEKLTFHGLMNLHQLLVLDSMSEHPHHQTTLFIESPSEDNGETRMVFFPNSALKILWFDFLKAQTKEAKTQYFKAQKGDSINKDLPGFEGLAGKPPPEFEKEENQGIMSIITNLQKKTIVVMSDLLNSGSEGEASLPTQTATTPITPTPQEQTIEPTLESGSQFVPRVQTIHPLAHLSSQLGMAIVNNDYDTVKQLIVHPYISYFINVPFNGKTPLFIAAYMGLPILMIELLNTKGIDINSQLPKNNWTALHGAAREDKCDSVALLLAAGASTSITNTRGNTAIQESRGNVIHVFNVLSDQGIAGLLREYSIVGKLNVVKNLKIRMSGAVNIPSYGGIGVPALPSSPSPTDGGQSRSPMSLNSGSGNFRVMTTNNSNLRRSGSGGVPLQEPKVRSASFPPQHQGFFGSDSPRDSVDPRTKTPEEYLKIIKFLRSKLEAQEQQLAQLQADNTRLQETVDSLLESVVTMAHDRVNQAIQNALEEEEMNNCYNPDQNTGF